MCIQGVLAAFKVHSSETAVIKANGGGDSPEIRKKVLAQGGPWAVRIQLAEKAQKGIFSEPTELLRQQAEMYEELIGFK
ncbi:hypothetical protein PG989_004647 [Apiospora arundinis]